MDNIKRYLGMIILLAVLGAGVYSFLLKQEETKKITYSTSDAKNLKGVISIALDSWIGYFPFRSPVFGQLMRDAGYRLKIIDDNADYRGRMKSLKSGEIDFAVCTIDSYIINGKSVSYPGAIVTVIDESKGGDALISWMRTVSNIDELKKKTDVTIAFTPDSPSEHLLKTIGVHFDVPMLQQKDGPWRVEVDGAEAAYKKFINHKVDLAVVWEPHVSEALAKPGTVKLMGSEDIDKLIVDILVANRKFAHKKPELVLLFLKNYFKTLNVYLASPAKLSKDIKSQINVTNRQVKFMLKGVKWIHYPENVRWFGLVSQTSLSRPEIIESITTTVNILKDMKDISSNPLPDGDPYTIINSSFLREMYSAGSGDSSVFRYTGNTLARKFKKLSDKEWNRLKVVGALKLRPVSFRSGTDTLDDNGRSQIRNIVSNVRHYPNFRILVKGHTGLRGDPQANRELSRGRARAVKKELMYSYNIDDNRIHVVGAGASQPFSKNPDESDREYNNRLKRVELLFVTGNQANR